MLLVVHGMLAKDGFKRKVLTGHYGHFMTNVAHVFLISRNVIIFRVFINTLRQSLS